MNIDKKIYWAYLRNRGHIDTLHDWGAPGAHVHMAPHRPCPSSPAGSPNRVVDPEWRYILLCCYSLEIQDSQGFHIHLHPTLGNKCKHGWLHCRDRDQCSLFRLQGILGCHTGGPSILGHIDTPHLQWSHALNILSYS